MSKYGITQTDFGWSNIVHTLQCPSCDFQTLRPEVLQEHCTRSHRTLRRLIVFSCPLCHARSTDVRLIDEHKRLYHTTDSVQAFSSSNVRSTRPTVRRGRNLESRNAQPEDQPSPGRDFAEPRRKREPSASTSSSHVASESSEECSVLRRTVRKSSIRAIAAMASPNLVPKESESSASEEPSPGLPVGRRRRSGDSGEVSPPVPSGSGAAEGKPQREGRLHPAVRAHMDVLFSRGVRRPDEMAAQLRRFVKAEFGGAPDHLQPSMWTVRRLLKAMAAEEIEEVTPSALPKRARINLASPPPASSPIKSSSGGGEQRPRKIFTSSDGPERLPVVKLEESHVELVRCLKCGVRVPFQSDGTRAAQDAALMAHLANSHGIRKREPIVYPAARQRSQSAQDHVTDLDAEAEEVKAEVRILKESGVLPAAVTSSSVQVKLERDEELRLTGARIHPSSSTAAANNAKPRSLKRPPVDDQEEVAMVAVRLKEPAVKEPPSERQQIDLDSLNTSSASTMEPAKLAETFELVAEFSDLEKEKEEASDQKEEEEEKEEGEEASPDELTRWAAEAMEVDTAESVKGDNDLESKENDIEPEKTDLEAKENDLEPEKTDLEAKENDLEPEKIDLEAKENDLESENTGLEAKDNDFALEKIDSEAEEKDLELEKVNVGAKENNLEPEKIDVEPNGNDLEAEKIDIEAKEHDLEGEKIETVTEKSDLEPENDLEAKCVDDLDQNVSNDLERKANDEPGSEEDDCEATETIRVVREANQKRVEPEEWQCRHCFAGFEDEKELKSHVEEIHCL